MRYGKSAGPVYCRYASTAPVINSELAGQYGLIVEMDKHHRDARRLEAGRHVKLRMLINNRKNRLTCHGTVDWVEVDARHEVYSVGFSHLSLSPCVPPPRTLTLYGLSFISLYMPWAVFGKPGLGFVNPSGGFRFSQSRLRAKEPAAQQHFCSSTPFTVRRLPISL